MMHEVFMLAALLILATAGATAQAQQPQWKIFGHLLEARSRFSVAALGEGKVLVMGGFGVTKPWNTVPLKTCELIDINEGTITPAPPMLGARAEFVALHTPDSNIVIIGGNSGTFNGGTSVKTVDLYDRVKEEWRNLGNLLLPRRQHVAVFINDHEILVAGGRDVETSTTNEAEIFDIATGKSRRIEPFTFPINSAVAGRTSKGDIIVTAGRDGGPNGQRSRTVYRFTPPSTWDSAATLTAPLQGPHLLRLWDGRLLLSGGSHQEVPIDFSDEVQIENSGVWSTLARMASERQWGSAAQWNGDTIITMGGFDNNDVILRQTDWINIRTGERTQGPSLLHGHKWFEAISVPVAFDPESPETPTASVILAIGGESDTVSHTMAVEILETVCTPLTVASPLSGGSFTLDSIEVHQPRCGEIRIANNGRTPMVISDGVLDRNMAFFTASGQFPMTIAPGEEKKIRLCFLPESPGEYRDTLRLMTECSPTALPLLSHGTAPHTSGTNDGPNRSPIGVTAVLFPNPASSRITIQLRHPESGHPLDAECTLHDLLGSIVARGRYVAAASPGNGGGYTEGEYRIDVEGIPSGTYIVSVATRQGTETFSVVVSH